MMYIISAFFGVIVIALIAGKINLSVRFNKEVKQLFSASKNISGHSFNYQLLEGLPEPVQRYFKLVLKEGQPYINYIRLKHDGQFKTDLKKDWVNITGEQYFTTQKPGFIWKGKTSLFVARDMYIADQGRLIATILSLINVVDAQGDQYNEGELLRWLAESVWFPTNLLPSERLQWSVIDHSSANLTFKYKSLSLFYIVLFNNAGEITEMQTQRYMNGKRSETWICKMYDYKLLNEIIIPTSAEALWRLKEGDFSYAKFNVKAIEYDNPEKM